MSDDAYLYVERGYQDDNATNIVLASCSRSAAC